MSKAYSRYVLVCFLTVAMILANSSVGVAEEELPSEVPGSSVPVDVPVNEPSPETEAPAQEPVDMPDQSEPSDPAPPPTELPTVAPTELPTELPTEETEVPTEIIETPTEVVPTEQPAAAIPTPAATEAPTELPATPTPTIEPTPTEIPGQITWNQADKITCVPRLGNANELAVGDTATWRCNVAIQAIVTGAVPQDLEILWKLRATYTGDDVRFQLPDGSLAQVEEPTDVVGGKDEEITYRTAWSDGQDMTFDVVVTRTTCYEGAATIDLNNDVELRTADTSVQLTKTGESPLDTDLISNATSNGQPTVEFDGPITFAPLSSTSAGLESTNTTGSATLVVEGRWNPCSHWTLNVTGSVDVPTDTPAELSVVSINGEPYTGEACDLVTGCDLLDLPETGDAASPITFIVGLEMQLHPDTPAGEFGIELYAELQAEKELP